MYINKKKLGEIDGLVFYQLTKVKTVIVVGNVHAIAA